MPSRHEPSQRLTDLRARLRRELRRRRRPVAAFLAGVATLVALTSLRSPAAAPDATASARPPLIGEGQVAVPITLSPPGVVRVLHVGQEVDLVSVSSSEGSAAEPTAQLVSTGARIVSLPESASAFSATSSAVVVVAVDESDGLALLATSSRASVTVILREAT